MASGHAQGVVEPFDPARIDCAAYTLTLGKQAFVTEESDQSRGRVPGLMDLVADEVAKIPPGQFAYLLTAEKVKIPNTCVGFISVKAKIKLQGLINVSGFHVDPGWDGHLIFAVFNAGSRPLVFRRGQPLFLLFLGELDQASAKVYGHGSNYDSIPVEMIQSMAAGVPSIQSLTANIERLNQRVTRYTVAASTVGAIATLVMSAVALWPKSGEKPSPPMIIQTPVQIAPVSPAPGSIAPATPVAPTPATPLSKLPAPTQPSAPPK